MVLSELGKKLQGALKSLTTAPAINKELLDAILKQICSALLESDVNVRLVQQLRTNILKLVDLERLETGANKKRIIYEAIYKELVALVDPGVEPFQPTKGQSAVLMMVGLQGAGKTTTCTKLAVHYSRKGYKVGLVCTDTFRAGAFDQLKQNATKAKIPYFGSYSESDPVVLAQEGVTKFKSQGFEVIIVDTSGRHHQQASLFEEMKEISAAINPQNVIFVMDGTIGQGAASHAQAFTDSVDVGSIVITKMDGHGKGGGAISAVAATKSPIIFIGVGEHMTDLEKFSSTAFINRMLGQGDLAGLMEKLADSNVDKESIIKNLTEGKFSFKDMKAQLEMISGLGPLSKIMGMIPGMPESMVNSNLDEEGGQKLKHFTVVMDSMTEAELQSDGQIFRKEPSRIYRIAKGSGIAVHEIQELIIQHSMMENMVKGMGGPNGVLGQMARMRQQGQAPSPSGMQNMMQQMMGGMPPGMGDMMQKMMSGGGMQDMMQRMMGGGMPDMSRLAGLMGAPPSSISAPSSSTSAPKKTASPKPKIIRGHRK